MARSWNCELQGPPPSRRRQEQQQQQPQQPRVNLRVIPERRPIATLPRRPAIRRSHATHPELKRKRSYDPIVDGTENQANVNAQNMEGTSSDVAMDISLSSTEATATTCRGAQCVDLFKSKSCAGGETVIKDARNAAFYHLYDEEHDDHYEEDCRDADEQTLVGVEPQLYPGAREPEDIEMGVETSC